MADTNRMNERSISLAAGGGQTTVLGVGREGVLNGGTRATLVFDCTAAPVALTVTVGLRATPDGDVAYNTTTYTLATGAPRRIDLDRMGGYELVVTATHADAGAVVVPVSAVIQAPGA
jgi:hypothetical protein